MKPQGRPQDHFRITGWSLFIYYYIKQWEIIIFLKLETEQKSNHDISSIFNRRIFYFKEQGRWESENFSFISEDVIQLHVSKFLANLGHIFKSNMNVRNASKASHCRMIFPLDTGVGTSGAVRFYQFKMWETCLLLTIQFTFHRLKERQAVSFHCLSKQGKNWRSGKLF